MLELQFWLILRDHYWVGLLRNIIVANTDTKMPNNPSYMKLSHIRILQKYAMIRSWWHSVGLCVRACVCVYVCMRERERGGERFSHGGRKRGARGRVCVCMCVSVCVCMQCVCVPTFS